MYLKTVFMVDLFGLNPVWHPFIMLFSLRWRINGLCKKKSRIFPGRGSSDIGLNSFGLVALAIFGIGRMVAVHQSFVYLPEFTILLYSFVRNQ